MKVPAPAPLLLATWGGISEAVSELGWGGAGLSPLLSPYPGAAGEPPHPHHGHHGQARAQPKNASPPPHGGQLHSAMGTAGTHWLHGHPAPPWVQELVEKLKWPWLCSPPARYAYLARAKVNIYPGPWYLNRASCLHRVKQLDTAPACSTSAQGSTVHCRGWGRSPKPHIHHSGEPYPLCVQADPDAAPAGYRVQDTGISSLPALHCPSPSPNPNPTPHPWQKDALTLADGRVWLGHREKGQQAPCPLYRAG